MRRCLVERTYFGDRGEVISRGLCGCTAVCDGRTFPICDDCLRLFYSMPQPCQFPRPAIFAVIRAQEARN